MRISLFFCILGLVACQRQVPQSTASLSPFFDLRGFLAEESERLTQRPDSVFKTFEVGLDSSGQKLKIKDWKQELLPFEKLDLNRPIWLDQYRRDTLRVAETGAIRELRYTALRSDLPVQALHIEFEAGKAKGFSGFIREQNALYASQSQWHYDCVQGYQLEKHLEVNYWTQQDYRVRVSFSPLIAY